MKHGRLSNRSLPAIALEWPALFRISEHRGGKIAAFFLGKKSIQRRVLSSAAAAQFVRKALLNPEVGRVVIFGQAGGTPLSKLERKIQGALAELMVPNLQMNLFVSAAEEQEFFQRHGAAFAKIIVASERVIRCPDHKWFELADWANSEDYVHILRKVGGSWI